MKNKKMSFIPDFQRQQYLIQNIFLKMLNAIGFELPVMGKLPVITP